MFNASYRRLGSLRCSRLSLSNAACSVVTRPQWRQQRWFIACYALHRRDGSVTERFTLSPLACATTATHKFSALCKCRWRRQDFHQTASQGKPKNRGSFVYSTPKPTTTVGCDTNRFENLLFVSCCKCNHHACLRAYQHVRTLEQVPLQIVLQDALAMYTYATIQLAHRTSSLCSSDQSESGVYPGQTFQVIRDKPTKLRSVEQADGVNL